MCEWDTCYVDLADVIMDDIPDGLSLLAASSHRAAIPSVVTARVLLGDDDLERQSVRRYKFNVNEGQWQTI